MAPLSLTQHTPASRFREFRDKSVSLTGPKCCFDGHQQWHANCLSCVWFSHGILQWLTIFSLFSWIPPLLIGDVVRHKPGRNISWKSQNQSSYFHSPSSSYGRSDACNNCTHNTTSLGQVVYKRYLLNVITLFDYVLSKTLRYTLSNAVAFPYIFLILAFLNSS